MHLLCCRQLADPTAIPASNASTGSSRPPEPPRPPAGSEDYDPCAADSDDYRLFGSEAAPHMLPPIPSIPLASATRPGGKQAGATGSLAAVRTAGIGTDLHAASLANGALSAGRMGSSAPLATTPSLPPPPLPGQPGAASRKRKSRWEDSPPGNAAAAADRALAAPQGASDLAAPAEPAQTVQAKQPRRSRFSDAPAAVLAQPGQGSIQPAPSASASMPSMPSMPRPPPPGPEPPAPPQPVQPTSAKEGGEAMAARALEAVEQMLQANRHSDARSNAPSTSRPKQPPPPAHQPPLPRPPAIQPPLPQMPPPQPAFTHASDPAHSSGHATAGPLWHAPHAMHAGHAPHAVPPFNPRPLAPFSSHQAGFPDVPTLLQQQGLQHGVQRPQLGRFAPQQFVQAGLQQHHRPAPLHHLPSMLQPQPPPHARPQPSAPPSQHYTPPPHVSRPPPQQNAPLHYQQPVRQGSSGIDRQSSFGRSVQQPGRPLASPSARQLPSGADLGHFHTTNVAMDTPTDTGAGFAWKRADPEGSGRVPGPPTEGGTEPAFRQLASVEDANAIAISSAEDDSIPLPPPSPPTAPPPPPLSTLGAGTATAPPSEPAQLNGISNPQSVAPPTQTSSPAAASSAPSVHDLPSQSAAATTNTETVTDKASAESDEQFRDAGHAAAPAGPAEQSLDQHIGMVCCSVAHACARSLLETRRHACSVSVHCLDNDQQTARIGTNLSRDVSPSRHDCRPRLAAFDRCC